MKAGRFVLVVNQDNLPSYVTSWDTWEECDVVWDPETGLIPEGFTLYDDETGRKWFGGARYVWEDAAT